MFKKLICICLTLFIGFTGVANATMPKYKEGEMLVRFAVKEDGKQRNSAEKGQILSSINGGTIKQSYKLVPGLCLVKLPANLTVKNAEGLFKNRKDILYAHPNHLIEAHSTIPNDPNYWQQWAMPKIQAPQAWDKRTSSEIVVAVIDSGVDYLHPDLADNMWVNEAELNGIAGYDDDGNGRDDDIYGYDFCTWNQVWDSDPMDDYYHGTAVAGVIGAVGDNTTGVAGTCWNVKIMALRFIGFTGKVGYGWENDVVACIEYAVANGAKVINASYGGVYSQSEKDAIETANAAGVLFVASAGNYNHDNDDPEFSNYPASYNSSNIVAVMSTDQDDVRSVHLYEDPPWASNYGATTVDLAAPGSYIFTTFPTTLTYAMNQKGYHTYYHTGSGTSFAAPHVSGACALVWGANTNLSHLQVKDIILDSVDVLEALDGNCVTSGRLNVNNAMLAVPPYIALTITDDASAEGVEPNDRLTYTIGYEYPNRWPNTGTSLTNVVITNFLPEEVLHTNVVYSEPNGSYSNHSVTWELGTLHPGDSGYVTVTVTVGSRPDLTGNHINTVAVNAAEIDEVSDEKVTPWKKVFNVTQNKWYAPDPNVLKTAIVEANDMDIVQVWPCVFKERLTISGKSVKLIAVNPDPTKTVIDGGPRTYNNKGIDYIDSNSLLSGFTIINCKYAIAISNSSPHIENCIISDCDQGFNCASTGDIYPVIVNSTIHGSSTGIYSASGSGLLTIRGSTIENCTATGINTWRNIEVTNCIIRNNAKGIECNSSRKRNIRNTIIYNTPTGIHCTNTSLAGSEINGCTFYCSYRCLNMNSGPIPVKNSILWGSSTPCSSTSYNIDYCCIQQEGYGLPTYTHNISSDPCFVNAEANDFHIKSDSNCIDAGNSYTPAEGEADTDKQPRVWGLKIDMGADEDVNDPDFDNNGRVNFFDYAIFANAWQTTLVSPNWNADCNIATNSWGIDYRDLDIFVNWWLWEANAYSMESESYLGDSMMMEQQQEFSLELAEELLMGIDYNFPAIYLTCDTNTPDVNDEVTVYVKSDWPLFAMEAAMYVNGDADIIDAMDSNEAPDFGWDPDWYFPELIDDGWVSIGGVRWVSDANGTVGYFKLRYNSGQISVYFDQQLSSAYTWSDANGAMLPFSQEAILIGRDPNE